ncbi:hypothetical protein BKA62DRAFT_743174 [Auriculariales sp. MPI-PUGE-AT-0066]|nr:hypothetical protein BKA62DRAFT_743174 [Auriculariales sp. MPI-PUGE-AT-0066]
MSTRSRGLLSPLSPSPSTRSPSPGKIRRRLPFGRSSSSKDSQPASKDIVAEPAAPITPPASPKLGARKVLSPKTWFSKEASSKRKAAIAALPPLQTLPLSPSSSRRSASDSDASSNSDRPHSRWSLRRRFSKEKSPPAEAAPENHLKRSRRSLSLSWSSLSLRRKSSQTSSTTSSLREQSPSPLPSPLINDEKKNLFTDSPPSLSPASTFDLDVHSSGSSSLNGKNKESTISSSRPSATVFGLPTPSADAKFDFSSAAPSTPTSSRASPSPASSIRLGKNKDTSANQEGGMLFTDSPPTLSPSASFDLGAAPPSPVSSNTKGKNKDTSARRRRPLLRLGSRYQEGPPASAASTSVSAPKDSTDEFGLIKTPSPETTLFSPTSTLVGRKRRPWDLKGKGRADSTPESATTTMTDGGFPDEKYNFDLRAATLHSYPPSSSPMSVLRRRKGKGKADSVDDASDTDSVLDARIARKNSANRVTFELDDSPTAVNSKTSTSPSMLSGAPSTRPSTASGQSKHSGAKETTLAVASLTFRALREIADGLDIPYAKGIAGLAVLITDSIQLVITNREACERLAEHVCQVVVAIINQMHGKDHISPQLKYNIEHLTGTLRRIHEFVVAQTKRSYFSRFMRSQDDVQVIQQYADELRHALDLFGLRSTIIIQHQLYRSAAIAQEYDDKILKSVKRNHALYMRAINGPGGDRRSSMMSSRKSTMDSTVTESMMEEFDEPLLHPRPAIFYGREKVLSDIVATLAPESDPLDATTFVDPVRHVILGAPGIGKSSLALAALHNARTVARYGDCRYFVPCDVARDGASLVKVLVEHFELEIPEDADAARTREIVLQRVSCGGRPAAICLDNFDSPWENVRARDGVESLLNAMAAIPSLAIIVTLRGAERPFGIGWTRPCIPPLAPLDLDASRSAFVALSDQPEDDPLLAKLLDRCGGHPLAITLMANIAQYETLSALLARWEQESTSMLDRGPQDRRTNFDICIETCLTGHRMRAAGEAAIDLMAMLCIVPDGFSDETLTEISKRLPAVGKTSIALRQSALAYDDILSLPAPAPLPAAALAASPASRLLNVHHDAGVGERQSRRLSVLFPVRAYFQENKKPKADHLAILEQYYFDLAARAATVGSAEDGESLVQILKPEIGNMQCIIERILAAHPHRRDAVKAAGDLSAFLRHTHAGSLQSLKLVLKASDVIGEDALKAEWLVAAATEAREQGDMRGAIATYEEALAVFNRDQADMKGQAHCIKNWALALMGTDEHAVAAAKLEEARALYRAAGDIQGQGECLVHLAQCALTGDDISVAQSRAEEAMRIFRQHVHATWQARCQKVLAIVAQRNGNLVLAATKFASALALFKKAGCAPEVADALARLAEIARQRCDFADALATSEDVLAMVRGFGPMSRVTRAAQQQAPVNRAREAHALLELGNVALALNNIDLARTRFEEASAIFKDLHSTDTLGQAACAVGFGDVSMKLGDPEEALAHYDSARCAYRRVRAPCSEADVLHKMGDAEHALNTDIVAGLTQHITALALYRRVRCERGVAAELRYLGDLAHSSGSCKDALAAYHTSAALCRRGADWRGIAESCVRIGDVCLGRGFHDGAKTRYERGVALYRKVNDANATERTQEKLDELRALS